MSEKLVVADQHCCRVHIDESQPGYHVGGCDADYAPTPRPWLSPERPSGKRPGKEECDVDEVYDREDIVPHMIGVSLTAIIPVEKLHSINYLPPLYTSEHDAKSGEYSGECFHGACSAAQRFNAPKMSDGRSNVE